ncbi:MAG: D-alanine--D-alanine ligase [Deinococcales bacterium]|jgi:D-alanine-D-alanine ligase
MTRAPRVPRVLLLCGGRSEEHEVSLASAGSVLDAVGAVLDVTALVIDRQGRLLSPGASQRALAGGHAAAPLSGDAGDDEVAAALARLKGDGFDVVFPLLHGPFGEDGSVQGLLRLLGLPFVGSDVLASAVAMDKLMMKAVFAAHGFPQVRFRGLDRSAWASDRSSSLAALADLPWPRFVKPANLGSSIGVRRVDGEDGLEAAVDDAFRFDRRVIVEEGVHPTRELEVGVLGNDAPAVSPVGEIRYQADFYDYQTKYTDGRAELLIPAPVPEAVAQRAQELAERAFRALDVAGLARVDFLYREHDDALFLNEVNTIPGFTRHSMYPKLWEAAGVPYPELVRRLVALALEPR